MTDNNGYVLAPLPVAPVNETDMVLLPKGLTALKQVAKEVGLDLRGAYVNLDGGFDSRANRKCIFNAGMIPNIKENPRNRKRPKRGRKRCFNAAIHALRMRVERTCAWEDKFKRLLLRFPATALWHEVVGLHVDQLASVLRYLQLPTSHCDVVFHASTNERRQASQGWRPRPLKAGHNQQRRSMLMPRCVEEDLRGGSPGPRPKVRRV